MPSAKSCASTATQHGHADRVGDGEADADREAVEERVRDERARADQADVRMAVLRTLVGVRGVRADHLLDDEHQQERGDHQQVRQRHAAVRGPREVGELGEQVEDDEPEHRAGRHAVDDVQEPSRAQRDETAEHRREERQDLEQRDQHPVMITIII